MIFSKLFWKCKLTDFDCFDLRSYVLIAGTHLHRNKHQPWGNHQPLTLNVKAKRQIVVVWKVPILKREN